MFERMPPLLGRIAARIESLSRFFGRLSACLMLVMVFVIVYDVGMRYLFHSGSVALQELEWHLFALVFLTAGAYTLHEDSHVRVDIFYQSRWVGARGRAWIDLLGTVFLLIPFCWLVISASVPFVVHAYTLGEGSPDPGGLPDRFLLKAAIPFGFFLLLMQGLALVIRCMERIGAAQSSVRSPARSSDESSA